MIMQAMQRVKKIVPVLCVLLAATAAFSACSKGASADVSMYELNKAMCAATDKFEDMQYASPADGDEEELFSNISDMDYSKVKDFFITYASDGMGNADELAVIRVKNKADLAEASASLTAHLEKRKALYATYDKSQADKLSAAKVVTDGELVALIVADDTDKIESAFHSFLSK